MGVQFNYIVPMSGEFDISHIYHSIRIFYESIIENLRGVKVVGEKLFSINGASSQLLEWEEHGFRVQVPAGVTAGLCDIAVKAILSGEFEFPEDCQLVSALYAISVSRKLDKPVSVEIEHCVELKNEQDCKYMRFGIAMCDQEALPYTFETLDDGTFIPQSKFGKVLRSSFSIIGTFKWLFSGIPDLDTASSSSNDENTDSSDVELESQESNDTAQTELPGEIHYITS